MGREKTWSKKTGKKWRKGGRVNERTTIGLVPWLTLLKIEISQ